MEKIGKLERVIFHNKENGYTVGVFETEDEQFTVTGSFHDPNPGVKYRIVGEFKMHRKYGEQFNAESYEEVIPGNPPWTCWNRIRRSCWKFGESDRNP
nr:hypothetical protein [uncultured Mogibacterium sp.]